MNWCHVVAVVALALISHLCLVYGLIVILPIWLAAPLVGGMTALVSQAGWRAATIGTLVGLSVGSTIAQPSFLGNTLDQTSLNLVFVFLGTFAAGASAFGLRQCTDRRRAEWQIASVFIAVIVALMWATTLKYNQGAFTLGEPTVNAWLDTPPAPGETPGDRDYFLNFFYLTHAGVPYYDAVMATYRADALGEFRLPNGIPGYRLPTLFALWQLLPAHGSALVPAFLLFATLAVGSAYAIGAQLAGCRAGLLSTLLVAATYLNISTSSFVVFVDGWAMAITLAGLALLVAAQQRAARGLLWAAVGGGGGAVAGSLSARDFALPNLAGHRQRGAVAARAVVARAAAVAGGAGGVCSDLRGAHAGY